MCSINDDFDSDDLLLTQKTSLGRNKTCRRCDSPGLVVLRGKDVYCRNCFLNAETHKFRAALGKSKLMNPNDKVLVGYSGCESSSALLHMLHSGVTESTHKRLLFDVVLLFIDEGAIFKRNQEEREKIISEIKNNASGCNFPFFITSLGEYFNDQPFVGTYLKINEELDQKLIYFFENIKSVTSKEDMLRLIKQHILLKCAEELKCSKIFTAEVGTDLAIKLLNSFSLGRGSQASFETGFCDSRHEVKILRPLQDFTRKEIVFYNKFHGIKGVTLLSITTLSPPNVTIQKLTEKFITHLQENFPSTVYTVFRTGEKLSVNNNQTGEVCVLCGNKYRTNYGDVAYTAVDAADFSRNVSDKSYCQGKKKCCGSCAGEKTPKIDKHRLGKYLCYGCGLIVRDIENIECLPKSLLQSTTKKSEFEFMREQISEFLIEDSPGH